MATIQRAQYFINGRVYHFETDSKVVRVLDSDGNVVGSLSDLMFNGVTKEGVDYRSIKQTGIYKVKNLKNVPSEIPVDKSAILQVVAVGNTKNPDVVFYKIIGANGAVKETTLTPTNSAPWTSGGVSMQNLVNAVNDKVGYDNLATSAKTVVGGVNENKKRLDDLNNRAGNIENKLDTHNHDNRYLRNTGGQMSGATTYGTDASIRFTKRDGKTANFAWVASNGNLNVGESTYHMSIESKDGLEVNGHKVYTDANSGEGSGINADKLDGVDSSYFVRTDKTTHVKANIILDDNSFMVQTRDGESDTPILETYSGNKNQSKIIARGNDLVFQHGSKQVFSFGEGGVWMNGEIKLNAQGGEQRVKFPNSKGEIGIYMNDGRGEMGIYDWGNGTCPIVFSRGHNSVVEIGNIQIGGKRVFLQNNNPGGGHPYGSIWIGF